MLSQTVVESLNFTKTADVALFVGEFRAHKSPGEFHAGGRTDDAAAQHEDVHIVMLHALMGRVNVMAESGANAVEFIGRDGSADTRAAEENASVGSAIQNGAPNLRGVVGVVYGLGGVRAEVNYFMAETTEVFRNDVLQFQSGVIGPYSNLHGASELSRRYHGGER